MSVSFVVGKQRVRFAGKTDVGRVRGHNEDALLVPSEMALGVVSDGMGGHACGEVASAMTVETIDEYYRNTEEEAPRTWPFRMPSLETEKTRVSTAIKLANSRIFETSQNEADKKGMGCTVDMVYFAGERVYVGHVGDSRVYRIRDGQMRLMTEDHSLLNDYRRLKEMSGEDVSNFPHKNVVVRALGLAERVQVDVIVDDTLEGDLYVLCSDGLNDMLDDDTIREIATGEAKRLDELASRLVDAANEAGGKDNITALLVQIEAP